MNFTYKKWRNLFLICLGIFAGTAFCMKWMEKDFLSNGSLFTIIGLEATYPANKVSSVLAGLDDHVRNILRYHLYFDFAFMAGVYPGIAALCMMGRYKTGNRAWKKILFMIALLQAIAFICDWIENNFLLNWIEQPENISQFSQFHIVVFTKWIIALAGVFIALPFQFKKVKL